MKFTFKKQPLWKQIGEQISLAEDASEEQIKLCKHFLLLLKLVEREYSKFNLIWDPLLVDYITGKLNSKQQIPIMGYAVMKVCPANKLIRWVTTHELPPYGITVAATDEDTIIKFDLVQGVPIEDTAEAEIYDEYFFLPTTIVKIDKAQLQATKYHRRWLEQPQMPMWEKQESVKNFAKEFK